MSSPARVQPCDSDIDKPVTDSVTDESMADGNRPNPNIKFMSGVVEGFYGRPWTAEQRKELFSKMQRWQMDTYLYAPKDDYKHRACWREPYSVDEAEHLAALIRTARQHCVTFVYGLSPGIDITYSSAKDMAALRRKLSQVAEFGCRAFALLFDDIDSEMRDEDKVVFQSFAHAQVSIANEMNEHLSRPLFLFCPTQYCASRAIPNVAKSQYLSTIGSQLDKNIDIMWTGPKVVSKLLTVESIEELAEVLHRSPVIWDNLHANDYDQKRLFMGPYSGRPVELKRRLRGVLTNPNCEFGVNFVAIRTLSIWCQSTSDLPPHSGDGVSSDIRLETEFDPCSSLTTTPSDETSSSTPLPPTATEGVYHPRLALRQALREWLPEFRKVRVARSPLPSPCQAVVPAALLANTGANVNTSTAPVVSTSLPAVLQPLGSSRIVENEEPSCRGAVLNSLADSEQIVVATAVLQPANTDSPPSEEPMECSSTPASSAPHLPPATSSSTATDDAEPVSSHRTGEDESEEAEPMAVESTCLRPPADTSDISPPSLTTADMTDCGGSGSSSHEDGNRDCSPAMSVEEETDRPVVVENDSADPELTEDDLLMLADLFYLPFEHGEAGVRLLHHFQWLKMHSNLVTPYVQREPTAELPADVPTEVKEWYDRASQFDLATKRVTSLLKRLFLCENRSLLYDIYAYIWDVECVLSQLNGYVKWLVLGCSCAQSSNYVIGNYTWFTRGWKESFTSGDSEPWIFRGGLTGDLERLLPVDHAADLLARTPEVPLAHVYMIRPYLPSDETAVAQLWQSCSPDTHPSFQQHPLLSFHRYVWPYLLLLPDRCLLMENDSGQAVGFVVTCPCAHQMRAKLMVSWLPELRAKYPPIASDQKQDGDDTSSQATDTLTAQECIEQLHREDCELWLPQLSRTMLDRYPGAVRWAVSPDSPDGSLTRRLLACALATLRASGCFGAHCCVPTDHAAGRQQLGAATFQRLEATLDGRAVFYGRQC